MNHKHSKKAPRIPLHVKSGALAERFQFSDKRPARSNDLPVGTLRDCPGLRAHTYCTLPPTRVSQVEVWDCRCGNKFRKGLLVKIGQRSITRAGRLLVEFNSGQPNLLRTDGGEKDLSSPASKRSRFNHNLKACTHSAAKAAIKLQRARPA
jgi:hypothetical protein